MKIKRKFKYVVKTHKPTGILGFTFGLINVAGLLLLAWRSFSVRGETTLSMGFAAFLMMVMSVAGTIMALICISDGEQFHRFGWIGLLCNLAALASLALIFNAGLA